MLSFFVLVDADEIDLSLTGIDKYMSRTIGPDDRQSLIRITVGDIIQRYLCDRLIGSFYSYHDDIS